MKSSKKPEPNGSIFKKILIVDDEEDLLTFLTDAFRKEGWLVLTASNGKEAIKIIKHEYCPVALVDIKMPTMDGLEFIENVSRKGINIKVIFMTGAPAYRDLKKGIEEGLFYFLEKPFPTGKVIEIADRAFAKTREEFGKDSRIKHLKAELKDIRKIINRYNGIKSFFEVKRHSTGLVIFFIFLLVILGLFLFWILNGN